MTGAEGGDRYYRNLNFDVDDVHTGRLAYVKVRYRAPKRAISQGEGLIYGRATLTHNLRPSGED